MADAKITLTTEAKNEGLEKLFLYKTDNFGMVL